MADYCAVADVQLELQHLTISVSTKPTSTQVTTWCGEVTADMDARFNAVGITVQVSDSGKLKVVKAISVNWVMWKILESLNVESAAAGRRKKSYDDAMRNIEKNPSIIEETSVVSSPPAGASAGNAGSRAFTRSGKDW